MRRSLICGSLMQRRPPEVGVLQTPCDVLVVGHERDTAARIDRSASV